MDRERGIFSQVSKEVSDRRAKRARFAETVFGDIYEMGPDGWEGAGEFLRAGKGLLVVGNHPSLTDGPKMIGLLLQNPEFRNKRILLPVAQHQFRISSSLNGLFGTELELISVVTPDTVRKHPEMADKQRQGFFTYGRKAAEVLEEGGIVTLFPQSERRPRIGTPGKEDLATEIVMRIGDHKHIDFGVLPVGISIPGVNPEMAAGLNIGHRYVFKIGKTMAAEELRRMAADRNVAADVIIYEILAQLVSEDYR